MSHIVRKTIQYPGKDGMITVLPSDKPVTLPKDIAKEAEERGLAYKHTAPKADAEGE